jgi:hypothetical protein
MTTNEDILNAIKKQTEEFARLKEDLALENENNVKKLSQLLDEKLQPALDAVKSCESNIKHLEEKLNNHIDTTNRISNVIVSGIPFKRGEDLSKLFKTLSSKLGYEDPPEAKLLRFNGADANKRPISIQFPTEYHKDAFLLRYYSVAKKLILSVFTGSQNDTTRIYIQHDLPPAIYKIYKIALQLNRDKKIFSVRINHGIVNIRKNADDKLVPVASMKDLEKFK